jgi:hypothetical protein
MLAIAIMQDPSTAGSRPWLRPAAARRPAAFLARLTPGAVVAAGLLGGLAWAFLGSLLLGLGVSPARPAVAWCWLAVELLIGAATFAGFLVAAPSPDADRQ